MGIVLAQIAASALAASCHAIHPGSAQLFPKRGQEVNVRPDSPTVHIVAVELGRNVVANLKTAGADARPDRGLETSEAAPVETFHTLERIRQDTRGHPPPAGMHSGDRAPGGIH